ncbi:SH3 domain-containing kinase-binding protein 1 [Geodia barretti]|uniref:SH3 domain-containing kinase-binding protein 1 n=1 Tax=Geodia barretti TaxID=519541 RepID=A0AA35WGM7_GEOBA|nr:SH3 domain-containing kinase-binding protein 1 [Geodia barretti]
MDAVVLVNYKKQEDDELNLEVGDLITDVTRPDDDDDGWCEGTKNGERGMFLDMYVEFKQVRERVLLDSGVIMPVYESESEEDEEAGVY